MKKYLLFLGLFGVFTHAAYAIQFQFEKDHCAAKEYQQVNPHSGGVQSGFAGIGDSGWAETGQCVGLPIQKLVSAASEIEVMTWKGVTRIAKVENLPLRPSQIFHNRIMYEAKQRPSSFLGCHTAQWALEWTATVRAGSPQNPSELLIEVERVPGVGNSDGGYIKRTSVLIQLKETSASETSVHMRFEIEAPGQLGDDALGAVSDYIQNLITAGDGGKAPGAIENPDCPNH